MSEDTYVYVRHQLQVERLLRHAPRPGSGESDIEKTDLFFSGMALVLLDVLGRCYNR